MKRLAVIDLGTNTFHLLIVEVDPNGQFHEIFRHQQFIKLAEKGIQEIGEGPFQRGVDCMIYFGQMLEEFQIKNYKAIGTAALRTAKNGHSFIEEVKLKSGIEIQLIDGQQEAQYIHQGVVLAIPSQQQRVLIMDIGGGSVEFIISKNGRLEWAQSFPIGISVLFNQFHHKDPIPKEAIEQIHAFLNDKLSPLFEQLDQTTITALVGASGTFDVIGMVLSDYTLKKTYGEVDSTLFPSFYQRIVQLNKEDRFAANDIPDKRADMIVVALILIDFILQKTKVPKIIISSYALKEGALSQMINVYF